MVTAEKRTENLRDTPISISVLSAKAIEDNHILSLADLGDGTIPSLRVAPFFSRPFSLIVNVRGVGVLSDANQPARDQGVGVYVDGVYLGRPQGLNQSLFELDNIEILKGPQGTLFGRNSEGGALNIVTRKPNDQYRVEVSAGGGNFGSYDTSVHVNVR